MVYEKPECTNPINLVKSLDFLSSTIGSIENYIIIDPEMIYKLQASLIVKPKSIIDGMRQLVIIANAYLEMSNLIADNAILKLQKLTDTIGYDMKTADFVEKKIKNTHMTDTQVSEGCKKIEAAHEYVKKFNETIEEHKTSYANAVSPNILKIKEAIEEITMKYNEANNNEIEINVDAANKEIEELVKLIDTEMDVMKPNAEQNLDGFETNIKEAGGKCEAFMEGFYNEFVQLFEN